MLHETLHSVSPVSASSAEQRRDVRKALASVGLLFTEAATAKSKPHQVLIRDLSLEGTGFRSTVSFEMESVWRMHVSAGPVQLSGRLRIAWCRPRPDGTYDAGGEFV